ncbi:gluconate 2-dehydrogenase subunit 3 family protein [Sinorhizobium alkalisoli]|uniref:gluconate 2-dehydrogenase subunit 3 family protein n=1 Tax=Sinorhizobium alkalisoli TaxID=1752398 RepID=UPI001FE4FFB7|nr:gluconate 2-dehydrogenase subunit 3 family protein [Sinorhizobium alkalisoli]
MDKTRVGDAEGLMFFNMDEARALDAMTARIVPSEPDGLGAREAGVVAYIDRSVAGYFRDLQGIYRVGLQQLDDSCRAGRGRIFADLLTADQDDVLASLDRADTDLTMPAQAAANADGRDDLLARFFAIVREHTIQGMFCDPIYGGNRNFTGWKLIGFPGAQWGYSADQMQEGFDATTIPILSLSDLQRTRTGSSND